MEQLHLHMTLPEGKATPEWIHLLPAGAFRGMDGRGPYTVSDPEQLILHTMQGQKRLVLDENHATDLAAQKGGSAPAAGWIVELQSRQDGIWGRVDWNARGRDLMGDRAYRGVSPAFAVDAGGRNVTRLVRASLTNLPNLTLTELHTQETGMNPSDIARRLGLPENTTQTDLEAALTRAGEALHLHTQAVPLAGLTGNPSVEAIVTGLRARTESVQTHSQQVTALETEVKTLKENASRSAAETALRLAADGGAIISDTMKTELIALHMQNPISAETIISGLPKLGAGLQRHTQTGAPARADDAMVAAAAAAWGHTPEQIRAAMGSAS